MLRFNLHICTLFIEHYCTILNNVYIDKSITVIIKCLFCTNNHYYFIEPKL